MKAFLAAVLTLVLTGCAGLLGQYHSERVSSSVVDFLYPKGMPDQEADVTPHLKLPVRVGLAFVPASQRHQAPSAAVQAQLLEQVRARFDDRPYVADIVVLPEAYLRAGRGFTTIDQLARLYGFDVIALVSYDQLTAFSDRKSSLLYWTVAGAYVVKGTHNDVHTFVDTAVFDVRSRKLLFRAPGIDVRGFNSTLVDHDPDVREGNVASLRTATADMIGNLEQSLDAFTARVKQDGSVTVSHRKGYTGGGGAGALPVALLAMAALGLALRRAMPRATRLH